MGQARRALELHARLRRAALIRQAQRGSRPGLAAVLLATMAAVVLPSVAVADVASLQINQPLSIAGSYAVGKASFGAQQFSLTADAARANPANACEPQVTSLTGQIAIVDRALCPYAVKAKKVQEAGAAAMVVVNNVAGPPPAMTGIDPTVVIPVLSVSLADGTAIESALGAGAVNATITRNPVLSPSSTALSFPIQPATTIGSPQTLTLTNPGEPGEPTLHVTDLTLVGANLNDFLITSDACTGANIPVQGSCQLAIRFAPAAPGASTTTLRVTSDAPASPLDVALSGTAASPPTVGLGPIGPVGPAGQQGAIGPVGPTGRQGAIGPSGPIGALVMTAYQASIAPRRVVVRYVMTHAADVTLSVTPFRRRATIVTRTRAKAGVNRIAWNRKLGRKAAARGAYRLTLTCSSKGRKTTSSLIVRLR